MAKEIERLLDISIKQGEDIAAIKQQNKDLTGWTKDILEQTKKTNGRVSDNETDIALLKQKNEDEDKHEDWSIRKASIIIGVILVIIQGLIEIIKHYGG